MYEVDAVSKIGGKVVNLDASNLEFVIEPAST